MNKLSIVIPCYNEADNIPLLLERFSLVIKRKDIEVILVNNGSSDRTEEVLNELLHVYLFARAVRVEVNKGYGFGILKGLEETSSEYVGWTHADLQTDPRDPVRALEIIEERGDPRDIYVKGSRTKRSGFDNFFTVGMSVFETLYLGTGLWDINAQPNVFHRSFMSGWQNPPHDFSLDLYAFYFARKRKLDVVRFPVSFPERIHGQSHWNTGLAAKWKFIKRTLRFSSSLRKELRKSNL